MNESFTEYQELVLSYLESLDYPELLIGFEPLDIALSMATSIRVCYAHSESPMMCAIIIWSMTMNYQMMSDSVVLH